MRSQKIRLVLTKEQEQLCWQYSKVARKFWNCLVAIDRKNNIGEFDELLKQYKLPQYHSNRYNRDIYTLKQGDYLRLVNWFITEQLKTNNESWSWYYQPNQSFIYNFLVREFLKIRFSNKGKVNFRSVEKVTPSFNVRCDAYQQRPSRIYLKKPNKLQIPTLGVVKICKTRANFDLNAKKQVAKISYDGKYWYLSYTEPVVTVIQSDGYSEGVGIDLGIKTLATVSDGTTVPNIKTFRRVRILNKRLKRLQRKVSRKYRINKCNKRSKTKNILKLERRIKLIYRSLKNIRINHIRQFVSNLVKKNPSFIAIEDLNVKGMMKNKFLAKDIQNCSFYTIREHLIRKAKERQIAIHLVNRFFPSSKTCSSCKHHKSDLKLSDRTYHCENCNLILDRDLNASLNLAQTDQYILI